MPYYFFAKLFFLPLPDIADFFGPFLVLAFVFVRWPRAGRPLRCRNPR
jgi:hypothetical protein